jgi:PIN domain nuclease of toxin-antitoxin system
VRLLIDTQLLIWSGREPWRLSVAAREAILAAETRAFSVASLWEVAIKHAQRRPDFDVDPRALRDGLLDRDYVEVPVRGPHALAGAELPPVHGDPFDRLLVAQARVEGLALLTADRTLAGYGAPVQLV